MMPKKTKRVGKDGFTAPANFRKVGHVYLHPADKTSNYPRTIFEQDPNIFQPEVREDDYGERRVYKWGLYDDEADTTGLDEGEAQGRSMVDAITRLLGSNNSITWYKPVDMGDPVEQYIDVLVDRKKASIKNNPEIEALCRNTSFTIKISLMLNEEDCWRIVRVPAATSLAVLHDQILCPVMGWSRAYHGYVFEDVNDGSVCGPQDNSGYIDMMHARMHFRHIMDDQAVPLAAIMRKVGDECFYVYDLGDTWRHRLQVIEVSEVAGGGTVELLDGSGACPPEDSNGLGDMGMPAYQEFLHKYKTNPQSAKVKKMIKQVQSTAVNYTSNWLTGGPVPFDPLHYPIDFHRSLLAATIRGPRIQKPERWGMDTFAENRNECAACKDRLRPLMQCAACKEVRYCSRECQASDWKRHKAYCKKK